MNRKILPKVFGWMFLGLLVTFFTAYFVSMNPVMLKNIFGNNFYWILIILEIIIAIVLSTRIYKMKGSTATCLYLGYTFLTGLTFSSIFILYEMTSIVFIFLVAAILFGIFALIGKFTKLDLSKISTFLMMGLVSVIILCVINMFIGSSTINFVSSIISILVFLGYTAYDIQMIMRNDYYGVDERNLAIIGAFSLYLDYINIFMDLLNIFGDVSD